MTALAPALSFVIPLYNSAATIVPLVKEIEGLSISGGHEIVLVNDGSGDETAALCRTLVSEARIPITFVEHARNFGEHNAVLTGWRQARGAHIVNLDDDGQNPPAEAVRLWAHACTSGVDVVYGHYAHKRHAVWRNLGSWFANRLTDWALEKPRGFYLSSFRCVTALVAKAVVENDGPFPYIDGLVLQVTQRIGSLEVQHSSRLAGSSGYTLRKLLRLWASTLVNFSVMPLRVATILGLAMAVAGFAAIGVVFYWHFVQGQTPWGWGSMMAALLTFAGVQLMLLGVIGEYIGRMFLTVNRRPQAVVREILKNG